MHRRRTILTVAIAGLLGLVVAALAIAGAWPFDTALSDPGAGRHIVWEGKVALLENHQYALDRLPVTALSNCPHCLVVARGPHGQLVLNAGNGIQGWPGTKQPSFTDCVVLRNKGTFDSVALATQTTSLQAVALHGWICATGGGDDGLIRMQYNGSRDGGYLFSVTSWGRPIEG